VNQGLFNLLQLKRACDFCSELVECRQQVVLPEIHSDARILFLGRNPGGCEDNAGVPFVGPGGDLLNEWLDLLGVPRSSLVVENIAACWSPNDRELEHLEIKNCLIWLNREIEELPGLELVVPLGKQACAVALGKTSIRMAAVLAKTAPSIWGIPCFPVHHPGYALRSEKADDEMREEILPALRVVMVEMGLLSAAENPCHK